MSIMFSLCIFLYKLVNNIIIVLFVCVDVFSVFIWFAFVFGGMCLFYCSFRLFIEYSILFSPNSFSINRKSRDCFPILLLQSMFILIFHVLCKINIFVKIILIFGKMHYASAKHQEYRMFL